ncbi:MAG TPA: hypothetical protein VGO25_02990 [Rhodanobacteraceae bacterium]|nr:hypothetical protein [Rhodanobacteraceae bacterium]
MKFGIRGVAFLASLMTLCSSVSAGTVGGPTMGLWFNPQESGRGYDIDLQGDTMIVTTYVYETSGDPIWYLSSGTYDHSTGVFQSTYDSYSGGQCFGCPYQAPAVQVGAAGPITITFHTNQAATLTYPGGSTEIVKFAYGFPTRTDVLFGEWALSYETGGVVGGDWIVFDTPYTDTSGLAYASGHEASATTTTALGLYNSSVPEAQILVTQGATQRVYEFGVFDDRRAIGQVTSTTGGVTTGPFPATGARLLYESEVTGGVVIGSTGGQSQAAAASSGVHDASGVETLQRAAEKLGAAKR